MDLSDETTACHEAGHAVMAWLYGRLMSWVSIVPDVCKRSAGEILFCNDCPPEYKRCDNESLGKRKYVLRNLLTMVAGTVAHDILKPGREHDDADKNDKENAQDLIIQCAWWAKSDRDREIYLNLVYAEAREEMEKHWPWVQAVAAALIERRKLSGKEVLTLKQ